jgi:predicted transcriptional regulator
MSVHNFHSYVFVRCTPAFKLQLDQVAERSGETISVVVRQAIREYLASLQAKGQLVVPEANQAERAK